jgi:F420-dependent oxidoreductase-like protein
VFVPQGWKMDLAEIDDPAEKFEAMTNVAKVADKSAFDSIWVYDHFHTVPKPEIEATFECWTISATLSRDTNRVNIGQMVGCNGYRNPSLYAKIASTVEVASHGRLFAGIGAGWHEAEWKAYGYPWWETKERMAHFREAVEIIHRMWTEERPVFDGKHYKIDGPINEPKGVRRPHIPLWIGGGGEQVTLKLVAKWADACNVGGGNIDVCRHKLEVLKRHCDTVGRDYSEITKSTSIEPILVIDRGEDPEKAKDYWLKGTQEDYRKRAIVGTAEEIAERFRTFSAKGIDYIILYLPRVAYDQTMLHRISEEVIPLVG